MPLQEEVGRISLDVIRPLCEATEKMFRRIHIKSSDRLKLSLSKDTKSFRAEFFSIRDNGVSHASYEATVRFPQKVIERHHHSQSSWRFSATDLTVLVIAFHWAPEQITFGNEFAKQAYKYILTNFIAQTVGISSREDLSNLFYQDSELFPLALYQKHALKFAMGKEGCALFMEQGTGKTPVVIARICNESRLKAARGAGPYRVLIVAPKNVRANWLSEFHKFATVGGRATVMRGDNMGRWKCMMEAMRDLSSEHGEAFTSVIASYENMSNSFHQIIMPEWDLCVLDESHYIKNPSTKRWKSLIQIRDRCTARMVLTGTPITNTMFDLYSQLEFLGEHWSGFSSFKAFKKFFGRYQKIEEKRETANHTQNQHAYEKLIGMTNIPMIQERLARVAYFIRKRAALPNLPEKVYDVQEIEMGQEQSKVYDDVLNEIIVELEDELTGVPSQLVVENLLTKMLRCAQVTSGFIGTTEEVDDMGNVVREATITRFDPNPKIEYVVGELEKKDASDKTIIWCHWQQDIKTLSARLTYEGVDHVLYYGNTSDKEREISEWRFNTDPKCGTLIGSAGAGGTGLNLLGYDHTQTYLAPGGPSTFCNHVIYFSQDWSPTKRAQSEDRPHRKGTVCHVRYTDPIVMGTIDQEIRERVLKKRALALEIQDIQALIERLKGLKHD